MSSQVVDLQSFMVFHGHLTSQDGHKCIRGANPLRLFLGDITVEGLPDPGRSFYKADVGYSLRRQIFIGGFPESSTQ